MNKNYELNYRERCFDKVEKSEMVKADDGEVNDDTPIDRNIK